MQNFLDEKIGDKNYDIGHLFHSSSQVGGLSHYGTVCKKGRKARAVSAYDFVGQWRKKEMLHREFEGILMHEIGHQFNAQHTFSFEIEGRAIGAQVEPAMALQLWHTLELPLQIIYKHIRIYTSTMYL
ncbi:zinc-dependent metalloprotease family protein [Ornithobacterium rhinotracheale]|uniref:zinc-dependent metalloprotease family protein n=1 Tax=Ornithobacterium rhinotracheale TaxID=28251 RepID=UPI00374DF0F6